MAQVIPPLPATSSIPVAVKKFVNIQRGHGEVCRNLEALKHGVSVTVGWAMAQVIPPLPVTFSILAGSHE
jgi:hypothetical protein